METIPIEMVVYLSTFLSVKSAKSLSQTCGKMYILMRDRIWNTPKFNWISVRKLLQMTNLPIHHLHSRDFKEFHFRSKDLHAVFKVLNCLPKLKSLTLDHYVYKRFSAEEFYLISRIGCELNIHSYFIRDWTPKIINLVSRRTPKVRIIFQPWGALVWRIYELSIFQGVRIEYIDTHSITVSDRDYNIISTNQEIINMLKLLNPEHIDLSQRGNIVLPFNRGHLIQMKTLKIRSITSRLIIDRNENPYHLYRELLEFKHLEFIRLERGTHIRRTTLEQFNFTCVRVALDPDEDCVLYGIMGNILMYMYEQNWVLDCSCCFKLVFDIYLYLTPVIIQEKWLEKRV